MLQGEVKSNIDCEKYESRTNQNQIQNRNRQFRPRYSLFLSLKTFSIIFIIITILLIVPIGKTSALSNFFSTSTRRKWIGSDIPLALVGISSSPSTGSASASSSSSSSSIVATKGATSSKLAMTDQGNDHQTESSSPTRTTTKGMAKNNGDSTIKWGIVGLGDVVQKKSGPPFWKCTGSELIAVMRRTPGKAAEFAKHRVPSSMNCIGYDNLDEMLYRHRHRHEHSSSEQQEEKGEENHLRSLDAIYVSTRPGTHVEICQKVADAGLACYVEKPVGRCGKETEAIVTMFQKANIPLYTAYISRAYDRTQTVRKLLQDGILGTSIIDISYTLIGTGGARGMDVTDKNQSLPWRLDVSQSGGGLIMDVGCHILDRIDYLCGPLVNVIGTAENRNSPTIPVEDYVTLTATIGPSTWSSMPGTVGAKVNCTWDFAPPNNEEDTAATTKTTGLVDELKFVGNNGKTLQMAGMDPAGSIFVIGADGKTIEQELTFDMPEHTAQQLIQAMTDELRGLFDDEDDKNRKRYRPDYLSYGDNAIRTSKVLDTVLNTYYGNRDIGFWDRIDSWPGKKKK